MRSLRTACLALGSWISLGAGCALIVSPDDNRLLPPDGSAREGGVMQDGGPDSVPPGPDDGVPDAPIGPDGAQGCATNCDDGIPCTVDTCNTSTRMCQHAPDNARCNGNGICDATMGCVTRGCTEDAQCSDNNACNGVERCMASRCVGGTALRCDDGQFCNGTETCNPASGCVPGTAPSCDDGMACTGDRCNADAPGGGACVHGPLDGDGDRYPALMVGGMTCSGGTDCNDSNPAVHPGAPELCNGVDDDCNGVIDDNPMCPPANDTCASAVALTLTTGDMTVMGTTVGAMDGLTSTCGRSGGGDVWYTITYPAANNLLVEVTPAAGDTHDPVLIMRDGCTSADILCNDDATGSARGSRVWVRPQAGATGMRTWVFVVDAYQAGAESAFTLHVATSTGGGSSCGGPLFDVGAGGALYGYVPMRASATSGSCTAVGTTLRPEDVVVYNGAAGRVSLTASARPTTSFQPSLYTRAGNCMSGTELGCDNGSPASTNFNATTGTATYIFVDNGPLAGGRYVLGVLAP